MRPWGQAPGTFYTFYGWYNYIYHLSVKVGQFYLTINTVRPQCGIPTTGRIRVGSSDGAVVPVSIACHLKPCMRFSLTRLSDNLLPTAFKRLPHIFSCLDNKSTLFHWLHTTFEIHTAHVLCISSVFSCNTPVSIASSTRIHQAV